MNERKNDLQYVAGSLKKPYTLRPSLTILLLLCYSNPQQSHKPLCIFRLTQMCNRMGTNVKTGPVSVSRTSTPRKQGNETRNGFHHLLHQMCIPRTRDVHLSKALTTFVSLSPGYAPPSKASKRLLNFPARHHLEILIKL
jgi:hypothetical protein